MCDRIQEVVAMSLLLCQNFQTEKCIFGSTEYVKNLEKELQAVKSKNRKLEDTLNDWKEGKIPSSDDVAKLATGDNALVKAHVAQLNDVLGKRCLPVVSSVFCL